MDVVFVFPLLSCYMPLFMVLAIYFDVFLKADIQKLVPKGTRQWKFGFILPFFYVKNRIFLIRKVYKFDVFDVL